MGLRQAEQARKALLEEAQRELDELPTDRGTTEQDIFWALVGIGQALVAIGHALNGTMPGEDTDKDA